MIHSEIKEAQAQKYEDELLDNSTNANNENQDTRNDTTIKTTITSEKENQVIPHTKIDDEDEFILTYFDFLKRTKKRLNDVFLSVNLNGFYMININKLLT